MTDYNHPKTAKTISDHDHSHNHKNHHHNHDHTEHAHSHSKNPIHKLAEVLHIPGFTHQHESQSVSEIINNKEALNTVVLAFVVLGITTILQFLVYQVTGSVALLGDMVHNFGDTLNSIPLFIALLLGVKKATNRFTYGYGKTEDIAGVFIVISVAFSAVYILWESYQKLIHPQPLNNLWLLALTAIIGFIGNEIVALIQIRVGKKIGSAAMVADGLHAQTDGLTSLGILVAVIGTALGYPIVDPIVGFIMGFVILGIVWQSTKEIGTRLLDGVNPKLTQKANDTIGSIPEVVAIDTLKLRWIGHQLDVVTKVQLDLNAGHTREELITEIKHELGHSLANLGSVTVESN